MKINMRIKRFLSVILALAMVCCAVSITPKKAYAVTNPSSSAESTYGLMSDVQDGVILHCWDWSFNNIKDQIPAIAAAGYTAIQTSPIQEAKEATVGKTNNNWWVFYQPKSFVIDNSGQSALGTKAEFTAMCDEAHKYGIKVIVDVVANHLGNQTGYNVSNAVASDIKDDSSCWHTEGFTKINYNDRNSITHGSMGGLPDLNTESTKIQGYVLGFLKECIDAGADGFRFDAAKHISVKAEGSQYTFWENTLEKAKVYATETRGITLYAYGEILHGTGGPAISGYTTYMSVTENDSSNSIRNAVAGGNAGSAANSSYSKGAAAEKLVLWAESHDTYSNDSYESTNISYQDINKTWALVASRANATSLYFARTNGYRAGNIGDIGTYYWKNDEVAAVNKFHNYFHGESEYLASSGSIAYNERGTSGVVLVNCSGTSTSVNVKANKMTDGTYTDQITGNTFTVSNGYISGNIGSTGIAVVYNAEVKPTPTISVQGGDFSTDTLSLTIGLKNATSGTYKIGDGSATTYTTTKTITIGNDMEYGDSVTVTLTATDGASTTTQTYTFNKVEKVTNIAYLKLPAGWSTSVSCYAYDKDTGVDNSWPGVAMTYDSTSGYYKYEIPDTISNARVIFYSSDTNRYPLDGAEGLACKGEYLYADGVWKALTPSNFEPPYEYGVYFRNTDGWDRVNAYYWKNDQDEPVAWPGTAMTDLGDGMYGLELDESFDTDNIIFNDRANSTAEGEQTADLTFVMNGIYNIIGVEEVADTRPMGKVIVKYVDESGNPIRTSKTLEDRVGESYTTTAATISGYTLKTTPANASGTYTEADITVTFVYSKNTSGGSENEGEEDVIPPTAVTGFSYSAVTYNSITLKWTKNISAEGYVIQQYKNNAWTTIKTISGNSTVSHKVTGLSPATSYQFRIKAYVLEADGSTKLYGSATSKTIKTKAIDLSKATLSISQPSFGYTGEYIKPVVTVKISVDGKTKTLTNWVDYKVTYKNFKNPGTATITVTGRGSYSGEKSMTFTIRPVDISKCSATIIQPSFGYTGDYIKPVVTVKAKINGKTVTLTNWKEYKLTYKNFKNPGQATITIEGRGICAGTKSLTFYIRPGQVNNVGYAGKSTTYASIKWDTCVGVTGYEVYKATSKFGTYTKIGTTTTTTFKNTGLKSKTTYYYKVRAYKTVGSTKLYGNYSTIYAISTK